MSYAVRMNKNGVVSGENEYVWIPRKIRANKYGVILFHGAGSLSMGVANTSFPDLIRMAAAIANAGIPIVSPSIGIDNYANDTAMTRMDQALAYLGTLGCDASKAHCIGVSMGGGTIARYAGLNPSKVASVNGMIPMANPKSLYLGKPWGPGTTPGSELNTFVAGLASSAAWNITPHAVTMSITSGSPNVTLTAGTVSGADVNGAVSFTNTAIASVLSVTDSTHFVMDRNAAVTGSYTANIYGPLPAGADIIAQVPPAKTAGIPGRMFYGTSDPYIAVADVQSLCTAAGWTPVPLTGAHNNAVAAAWRDYNSGSEFSDLITFLLANGA